MSTIISFLPDDNKNILKDKGSKNYKMTEIRPPSIPSNRERIINKDDVVLNVKGFYNDLNTRLKDQNDALIKIFKKSEKILNPEDEKK